MHTPKGQSSAPLQPAHRVSAIFLVRAMAKYNNQSVFLKMTTLVPRNSSLSAAIWYHLPWTWPWHRWREGSLLFSKSYTLERRKIQKKKRDWKFGKSSSGKWTNVEKWCAEFDTEILNNDKGPGWFKRHTAWNGNFYVITFLLSGRGTSWSTEVTPFSSYGPKILYRLP